LGSTSLEALDVSPQDVPLRGRTFGAVLETAENIAAMDEEE